ncbi:uncharacterized protein LOC144281718 [Canis aureus]
MVYMIEPSDQRASGQRTSYFGQQIYNISSSLEIKQGRVVLRKQCDDVPESSWRSFKCYVNERNDGRGVGTKVTGVIQSGGTISPRGSEHCSRKGARVGLRVKVNRNQSQHVPQITWISEAHRLHGMIFFLSGVTGEFR